MELTVKSILEDAAGEGEWIGTKFTDLPLTLVKQSAGARSNYVLFKDASGEIDGYSTLDIPEGLIGATVLVSGMIELYHGDSARLRIGSITQVNADHMLPPTQERSEPTSDNLPPVASVSPTDSKALLAAHADSVDQLRKLISILSKPYEDYCIRLLKKQVLIQMMQHSHWAFSSFLEYVLALLQLAKAYVSIQKGIHGDTICINQDVILAAIVSICVVQANQQPGVAFSGLEAVVDSLFDKEVLIERNQIAHCMEVILLDNAVGTDDARIVKSIYSLLSDCERRC